MYGGLYYVTAETKKLGSKWVAVLLPYTLEYITITLRSQDNQLLHSLTRGGYETGSLQYSFNKQATHTCSTQSKTLVTSHKMLITPAFLLIRSRGRHKSTKIQICNKRPGYQSVHICTISRRCGLSDGLQEAEKDLMSKEATDIDVGLLGCNAM
jgi:hypothetical protein